MCEKYKIVYYLDSDCKFPFTPDEVINKKCSLFVINVESGVITNKQKYSFTDFKSEDEFLDVLVSELCKNDDTVIYAVHPTSVILPMFKWVLMKRMELYSDRYLKAVQSSCIDLCDAFHKPTFLTIDRRMAFDAELIRKWIGPSFPQGVKREDMVIDVLFNLCQKL